MVRPFFLGCSFVQAAARGNVHFTADDGLDPVFDSGLIEMNGTEQIAMIGQSKGRHPATGGFFDEFFNPACPVEQAVLGMNVEVDKWRRHNLMQ